MTFALYLIMKDKEDVWTTPIPYVVLFVEVVLLAMVLSDVNAVESSFVIIVTLNGGQNIQMKILFVNSA